MRCQILLLFAMLLSACSVKPPITDPLSIVPNDFSLDVTVVTTKPHILAHMRSSRFVVFPDGALHHGDTPGWGPNTLPPRTRTLSREQIGVIWNRLDQLGMATSMRADETVNFQLVRPPENGSVYMVAIQADGDYWNFIRYLHEDDNSDPAFTKLIRLLAGYAWATDQPNVVGFEEPVRYDLGGNPYERYMGEGTP